MVFCLILSILKDNSNSDSLHKTDSEVGKESFAFTYQIYWEYVSYSLGIGIHISMERGQWIVRADLCQ